MRWTFGPLRVCFLGLISLEGCSYTDPGVEGLTRGEFAVDASPDVYVPTGDSGPKTDAGPKDSSAADAPVDTGGTTTAFTGAGAYASNKPATSAVTYHTNNNVGVTPGLGVDCLSCHKNGGAGVEFLFGGTVFQDKAGTMPLADVEVRVLGSDNNGYTAHSDNDGNYWFKKGATGIAFPAMSGARTSAQTVLMSGNITVSNCNGCHDTNTTDALHVP
jgi:hypothetical protein